MPLTRVFARLFAVAVVLTVTAVPAAVTAQEDGPRPNIWSGTSMAAGTQLVVNTDPSAVPVRTLLDARAPSVESEWDSQGLGAASAAAFDPGASVTGGPQLLCDFGLPCPDGFPPDYPFDASAAHPGSPDANSPTGLAQAHAGRDYVAASSKLGNAVPLGPLKAAVTVGAGKTTTRQEFVEGVLTVTARNELTDVRLGGGAVTIGSITSVAVSRASGGNDAASTVRMAVAGIRAQDGTVIVGRDGVTVAGQGTDGSRIREINTRLASALEGSGVRVRLLGAGTATAGDGATTKAHVYGIAVKVRRELAGPSELPQAGQAYRTYVLDGVLAQAGTSAYATNSSFGIGSTDITVPEPDTAPPTGTSGQAFSSGTVPGADGTAADGTSSSSPALSSGSASTSATGTANGAAAQVATAGDTSQSSEAGFSLLAGDAATWVVRGYLVLGVLAGLLLVGGRMLSHRLLT